MTGLLDLPDELLAQIIEKLFDDPRHTQSKCRSFLLDVFWTCKRLNNCCYPWLFPAYFLRLQKKTWACKWDEDFARARIAYFARHAPHVRKLTILCSKDVDGPGIIPDAILPALLDALSRAMQVKDISINAGTRKGTLPLPFWTWLTEKSLTRLDIRGVFGPPDGARRHQKSMFSYCGPLYGPCGEFAKLVSPTEMKLSDVGYKYPTELFKPRACEPQYAHLKKLVVHVNSGGPPPKTPIFDFSQLPACEVIVYIAFNREFKFGNPGPFTLIKRDLPYLFPDNLDTHWDVMWFQYSANLSRKPLQEIEMGYKPLFAHHHLEPQEEAMEAQDNHVKNIRRCCRLRTTGLDGMLDALLPAAACIARGTSTISEPQVQYLIYDR